MNVEILKMSLDYVFSVMYCWFWALLLIPLIFIIVKIVIKEQNSRDFYSISTFVFMILMLGTRAATIFPIILQDESFAKHDSFCEEIIYSGTPIILFSLSILVHTFRWFKLQFRLISSKPYPHKYNLFLISTVAYYLSFLSLGYWLFCINNNIFVLREMYGYILIASYWIIHIIMIVFNIYLFCVFTSEINKHHPTLYKKIKLRLNMFYIFIIILLFARLVSSIPMAIEYHLDDYIVVPSFNTLMCLTTELLPVLVMMFSFIKFGSSSNDEIENMDEFAEQFYDTNDNISYESNVFGNDNKIFLINEHSDICSNIDTSQKDKEDKSTESNKSLTDKTPSFHTSSQSNETIVDNEVSYKKKDIISSERGEKEVKMEYLEPQKETKKDLNHREENLNKALFHMMSDMGFDRPSEISSSVLDQESSFSYTYKEEYKFNNAKE